MLADVIAAADAERVGIVNRVVPAAELDGEVDAVVARLLTMAPVALSQTKHLLDQAMSTTFEDAVEAGGDGAGGEPQHPGRQGSAARVHGEARPGVHRRSRRVAVIAASTGRVPAPSNRRARAPAPPRPRSTARAAVRLASWSSVAGSPWQASEHRGRVAHRRRAQVEPGRAVLETRARPARRRVRARRSRRRRAAWLVPAADGLRRDPGYAITVRPYSSALLGGDARTALQRGLHDDHHLRQTRDDPVAHRERLPTRLHAVAELAHEQARATHTVEQHAVPPRVDDVEPGADDTHHRAARVERALVRGGVDPDREAAHHRDPGPGEGRTELVARPRARSGVAARVPTTATRRRRAPPGRSPSASSTTGGSGRLVDRVPRSALDEHMGGALAQQLRRRARVCAASCQMRASAVRAGRSVADAPSQSTAEPRPRSSAASAPTGPPAAFDECSEPLGCHVGQATRASRPRPRPDHAAVEVDERGRGRRSRHVSPHRRRQIEVVGGDPGRCRRGRPECGRRDGSGWRPDR